MKSQLENLPRYSTEDTHLPAAIYNKVKLGLFRIGNPLRFSIHGLRHLEIVIDHETWICRDVSLNDIPVLAWTDFNTSERSNLHNPVPCKLYTYHAHAMLIIDTLLEQLDIELTKKLPQNKKEADITRINQSGN